MSKIYRTEHLTFEVVKGEISIIAVETWEASVLYSEEGNKNALFLASILESVGLLPKGWTEEAYYPRIETGEGRVSLWDNCTKVELVV